MFEAARDVLLRLKPTGPDGFEGLLSVALEVIVGVPFRLAASGAQHGADGWPAYPADSIAFEAKRYDDPVKRETVLPKIVEMSISGEEIDLWILGATAPVSSQIAAIVRESAKKHGIVVAILDWSNESLPSLAVALALARKASVDFIRSQLGEKDSIDFENSLTELGGHSQFEPHANRIRAELTEPTIGAPIARDLNRSWLRATFGSSMRSKQYFRQALAPGESSVSFPTRSEILGKVSTQFIAAPTGKFLIVTGGEGNGKSWLVATAWLGIGSPPLTIFVPAEDAPSECKGSSIERALIESIITQTGGRDEPEDYGRWKRTFHRWRKKSGSLSPRLVVVLDGLNQRPELNWARIIEAMNFELQQLGGALVVTARSHYFESSVRCRLDPEGFARVSVPEWTIDERNEILAAHHINSAVLSPSVGSTLRNPRVLALVLKLFSKSTIESLTELTVSRLLYEYLRFQSREGAVPVSPEVFALRLKSHAKEVIQRTQANVSEDLMVFEGGVGAVGEGLFFSSVPGDASRYILRESGLNLALGFALVDEALRALRNLRDVREQLSALLDPIAALDRAADALFAALTITCIDDQYDDETRAAFVEVILGLQNVGEQFREPFYELSRQRPEAFLRAAERRSRRSQQLFRGDWLRPTLLMACGIESAWAEMKSMLSRWLRTYSLEVRTRHFGRFTSADEKRSEHEKEKAVLSERLQRLSLAEGELKSRMLQDDTSTGENLAELAFSLMAGKPLAEFGEDLVAWRFGTALNSNFDDPHLLFAHLIRLNPVDWSDTRAAMLKACEPLRADPSYCGKWTLHGVLDATGDPLDANEAAVLYEQLTKDKRQMFRVGKFSGLCSSDPCDPASADVDVEQLAREYSEIDVSTARQHLSQTQADYNLARTRAAVARFATDVGVAKHREFMEDVHKRSGFPLRQGVLELRRHNMLVERNDAVRFLGRVLDGTVKGTRSDYDEASDVDESDEFLSMQYHLLLAFPQLSYDEQVNAMLAPGSSFNFLLDLLQLVKRPSEEVIVRRFKAALDRSSELELYIVMAFAAYVQDPLPAQLRSDVLELASSKVRQVREQALGLIASSGDSTALQEFSDTGWRANDVADPNSRECWNGCWILIRAARCGFITGEEVIERIHPHLYDTAARELGGKAALRFGEYIDAAILSSAGAAIDRSSMQIELPHTRSSELEIPRFKVDMVEPEPADDAEALRRMIRTDKQIREQNAGARGAFESFKSALKQARLDVLCDDTSIGGIEAALRAQPALAESWFALFMKMAPDRRALLHHIGFMLVAALASTRPEDAVKLYEELAPLEPAVWHTFGHEKMTLDSLVVWRLRDHEAFEKLQFGRLDGAANDDEIATEVLAAIFCDRCDLLDAYVSEKLSDRRPAEIARALMVCGYSIPSSRSEETFRKFRNTPGFLGAAAKSAASAYEKHLWALHWFDAMRSAATPGDLWRFSHLFRKIVDARFELVLRTSSPGSDLFELYRPSIIEGLFNRYEKRRKERSKRLFGMEAPSNSFFTSTRRSIRSSGR